MLQFVELELSDDCLDTRLIGHPALYAQALELLLVTMTQESDVRLELRLLPKELKDADGSYHLLELRPSDSDRWAIDAKVMTVVRMLLKPYACPIRVSSDSVVVGLLVTRNQLLDAELEGLRSKRN